MTRHIHWYEGNANDRTWRYYTQWKTGTGHFLYESPRRQHKHAGNKEVHVPPVNKPE
jgi:hypothetical protein